MKTRGVALLLALFTLVIISLLVVAFLETTAIDLQIVSNQLNRNKALYIADAGIEDAVSRIIIRNRGFSNQIVQLPSGSGNTYNVTYVLASGIINSTGTLASGGSVKLQAEVSVVGSSSPFNVTILYWSEL